MWSCPQVARFWNEVLNTVGHIIGRVMPTDPKLCILNIYPANFVITNDKKSLIDMCLLEAKRCIARSWKKTTVCSVLEWLNGVTFYMALEKISYFTKNKIDRFWKSIWKVFYNFLENGNIRSDGGSGERT